MCSENQTLRLLLHNIPCYSTQTQIEYFLEQKGFLVKFVNIKVASRIIFAQQKQKSEDYMDYVEQKLSSTSSHELDQICSWNAFKSIVTHKGFTFPISCYVELFGDENTIIQLNSLSFDIFQQPIQMEWLKKSSLPNFVTSSLLWYPDIFSQIIKFFHAPPRHLEKIHKMNSYNIWFAMYCNYNRGCLASFHDSFLAMKCAIWLRGFNLVYAGPFQNNKTLLAVAKESILKYIEETKGNIHHELPILENDKDIALALVKTYGYAYRHLGSVIKQDREVILATINYSGLLLEQIPCHFQEDRYIVELAINQNPDALRSALPQFRDDKELVLQAVSKKHYLFSSVSERLQNDEQIFAAAKAGYLEKGKTTFILRTAHDFFKRDKEVVLAAVTFNGDELQYASEELKGDEDILQAALLQNENALQYALDQALNYPQLIEAAKQRLYLKIKKNGNIFASTIPFFKQDKDITMAAVTTVGLTLRFALPNFQNDFDVVMAAVKQNGNALQFASENMKENREIVKVAVATNGNALQFATKLNNDEEIVKIAVHQNGYALRFASDACQQNKEILIIAVTENIQVTELITDNNLKAHISKLFKMPN